jgi:Zn-dependent protease
LQQFIQYILLISSATIFGIHGGRTSKLLAVTGPWAMNYRNLYKITHKMVCHFISDQSIYYRRLAIWAQKHFEKLK